ncbi:MAG: hypothetical protein HYU41_10980 [Candidatus Rokubacteria bacterium]|nr:hypothetical protein [Candidatus Rokubacteria bacterium]
MRELTILTLVLAAALLAAGCAALSGTPSPSTAAPAPVVAAGMMAPEEVVPAVTEAVKSSPASAAAIAGASSVAVPDQAAGIRSAVIRLAPDDAASIVAATDVKPRPPAVTRVEIPNPDRVATIVASADKARIEPAGVSGYVPQGLSRFGSDITRVLATAARSVRQFVDDLR